MESRNLLSWEGSTNIIKPNFWPGTGEHPKNDICCHVWCKTSSFLLQTSLLIHYEAWSYMNPTVPGLCRGHSRGRLNLRANICVQQTQLWCGPWEICVRLKWDYKTFEHLHTSIPVQLSWSSLCCPRTAPAENVHSPKRPGTHLMWRLCCLKELLCLEVAQ